MSLLQPHLPPLPGIATIQRRLSMILPKGTPNRANATGERASKTAFVLLYIGAVEGTGRWARPDQVTRMSDAQAARRSPAERSAWAAASVRKLSEEIPGRWYSVNSREGIRDDTIRYAWLPLGAIVEKPGLAPTSSTPRWAIEQEFAELLTWGITDSGEPAGLEQQEQTPEYQGKVDAWRQKHLSAEARARVQLLRRMTGAAGHVSVNMPDGSARRLSPGDSSLIAKAVIEEFAPVFLVQPGVIWLSESSEHVSVRDDELARLAGLRISDSRILPDIVLVDLNAERLLLVFCEVVATDGAMNESRKADILRLVSEGGFDPANVVLMTAFLDRDSGPYRRLASTLAWGSLAWTAAEPDKLTVHLDAARSVLKLYDLLAILHPPRRGPSQ